MITVKFIAEIKLDADRLIDRLTEKKTNVNGVLIHSLHSFSISSQNIRNKSFSGEVICELTVKNISLEEIINIIKTIDSSHYMLETIELKENFTGIRK